MIDTLEPPLESLVARVRGEYFELVREGFLCKTDKGFYIAAAAIRRRL
jgi:hypothetical protein